MIKGIASPWNMSERCFITLSLLPKATVQAAIGATTLLALQSAGRASEPGEVILAVAVLSIICTAAPAAWAINFLRFRLLEQEGKP